MCGFESAGCGWFSSALRDMKTMNSRPVTPSLSADSIHGLETEAYTAARDIRLTVFVACYNEEHNIIPALDMLSSVLNDLDFNSEVIIIDDGSTDNSVKIVSEYIKAHQHLPLRLVASPINRGLAYNYVEGAFMGRGEYYRLICGDGGEPRETFIKVASQMGTADIIIPYPVWTKNRTFLRRAISKSYTALVNLISGYRLQYYNGLPLCRRQDVLRWHSHSRGFGFQAELVTRLLDQGASYREVGVLFSERAAGVSSAFKLHNVLSVFHTVIELVIRRISRDFYRLRRSRMLARQQQASGQIAGGPARTCNHNQPERPPDPKE